MAIKVDWDAHSVKYGFNNFKAINKARRLCEDFKMKTFFAMKVVSPILICETLQVS